MVITAITIEGNGAVIERSSAPGTPPLRLFTVAAGASLTIKQATIRNGRAPQCAGLASSGTLALDAVVVERNTATGAPGAVQAAGGGLCNLGGTLIVGGFSLVSGIPRRARPPRGGRRHLRPRRDDELTNSWVIAERGARQRFRRRWRDPRGAGGPADHGRRRHPGNAVAEPSWAGPRRFAIGGGICAAHSATVTMTGGEVIQNFVVGGTAGGQPTGGGGIYLSESTGTLTGVSIRENTAGTGAGVLLVQNAVFTMVGGAIRGNQANGFGAMSQGGAGLANGSVQPPGTAHLSGVVVEGNRVIGTTANGGGILTAGPLVVDQGSIVRDNHATDNGGGIYVTSGTVSVVGSVVEANRARRWAGVGNRGTTTLLRTTVHANEATLSGGGGLGNDGTLRLGASFVTDNRAGSNGNGGGIEQTTGGILTLENTTVSGNTAVTGGGIGLIHGVSTLTVRNRSLIRDNVATGAGGGGLYAARGAGITIMDSEVKGNRAPDGNGGGVNATTALTATRAAVIGNSAAAGGRVREPRGRRHRHQQHGQRELGLRPRRRPPPGRDRGRPCSIRVRLVLHDGGQRRRSRRRSARAEHLEGRLERGRRQPSGRPDRGSDRRLLGWTALRRQEPRRPGDGLRGWWERDDRARTGLHDGAPASRRQRRRDPTHALQPASPAIDAAARDCTLATANRDQRNSARPIDGDGDGSVACDVGAFERSGQVRLLLAVEEEGPGWREEACRQRPRQARGGGEGPRALSRHRRPPPGLRDFGREPGVTRRRTLSWPLQALPRGRKRHMNRQLAANGALSLAVAVSRVAQGPPARGQSPSASVELVSMATSGGSGNDPSGSSWVTPPAGASATTAATSCSRASPRAKRATAATP